MCIMNLDIGPIAQKFRTYDISLMANLPKDRDAKLKDLTSNKDYDSLAAESLYFT